MSKYFGYKDDIDDFRYSSGIGKFGLLGKMALKTVANVGIFAVTNFPKETMRKIANDSSKSDEVRAKAKDWLDKYDK